MGYYFIVVGAIISLFAAWATFGRLRILVAGERANGTIIGFSQRLRYVGDVKRVYYHAQIEFHTVDGKPVVFTYGYGSTKQRDEIGQSVTVLYDATVPEKATVDSFMGVWAGPLAATLPGGGCLYAGIDIVFGT